MRNLKNLYYAIMRLVDQIIYRDASFPSWEMHSPYQKYLHPRKVNRLTGREHIPGPVTKVNGD